ncbi:DeoR/GlpR transcriptional regulator [bacterium]|nr:MAG: DeoR/GlpR transcriptional regulator [bacterium]
MLTAERRQYILNRLRQDGKVVAVELSAELELSEDTIRRDLRELATAGLLQRVHGGALPSSPATAPFTARQQQSAQAKSAIARAAAGLMQDGQVIILDGGTTALLVAQSLPDELRATIVTNSPPVATALAEHPGIEVIVIGGKLYKSSLVTVGAAAIESIERIRADLCMLGVCSVHPEAGVSVPDSEEAYVKRAMIESSAEVAALVSTEKLGTAASFVVAPITALTHLVTEAGLPEAMLAPYRQRGLTIVTA